MRCPVCNTKLQKRVPICHICGFRFPPRITFGDILSRLSFPMIISIVLALAGIGLIIFRLSLPSDNREAIITSSDEITLKHNVGVVFFESEDDDNIDKITSDIEDLDIDGEGQIRYKYNTSADVYQEAIKDLIKEGECKDIIITGNDYFDKLPSLANQYPDIDFYVFYGTDDHKENTLSSVYICHIDLSKIIYAQGFIAATKLTDCIAQVNNSDSPQITTNNYTVEFLYKSDKSFSKFEQFKKGVLKNNMTLVPTAIKVTDEEAYANKLALSDGIHTVFMIDEMPQLTKSLIELKPEDVYISGMTDIVSNYPEYMAYSYLDYETYLEDCFISISSNKKLENIYQGNYDNRCVCLDFNSEKLPIGTEVKTKETIRE